MTLENNQNKNGIFGDLSPRVKMALISLVDDFYSIEKQHTVVVMPFFGLLHTQGNESKPFLNYVDLNILDLMHKHFKQVVVYPGENRYLRAYGLHLNSAEHLANEQNLLSRIVNRTTNFDGVSERHNEIICLYQKALANFDAMKERCPLPYKTAFDIQSPEELLDFITQLDKKIKQEDCRNKLCLVCPVSYLTEHSQSVYNSVEAKMQEIGGRLYFAQNQSDGYLYNASYRLLYDEQFKDKFVQSIQDFVMKYNEDIITLAKNKLNFDEIVKDVKSGKLGSSEKEILGSLYKINVGKMCSPKSFKNIEKDMGKL